MYSLASIPGVSDSEHTEKVLGRIEGELGKILPKIIRHEPITNAELALFCYFLNIFFRRSPYMTDVFGPAILKPVIEEHHRQRQAQAQAIPDESRRNQFLEAIQAIEEVWSNDFGALHSLSMFVEADTVPRLIYEGLTGAFFFSRTANFVTSDNPVSFNWRRGIKAPEGYVVFPVSRSVVFVAGRFLPYRLTYSPIPDHLVTFLNGLIISNAYQEVYASEELPDLQRIVDQTIGTGLTRHLPD